MKLGIVGIPNVGKSTLFNAITNAGVPADNYAFCTIDPNVGVVSVPEKELTSLLTRWAREADENGTSESKDRFLRRIGDCAKKYDSRNSTTVFRNVWRSVDAVLTEYDDCKKLLEGENK